MRLQEHAAGRLRVVHVPKTIDNDLDLPHGISTFGFQTARHLGVEIVKNLMTDARTTSRWYLIFTMGRQAGHLALGIGKAAGATLTLIPEEFGGRPVRLSTIVDTLAAAIIKRRSTGHPDGTAVLAEGLVERLAEEDLIGLGANERDEHDHIRLSEVDFPDTIKSALRKRLKDLDVPAALVVKDIGYELRSADPIPFDMEYTRDLGYCAAQYLLDGGSGAMVTLQDGRFKPVPFSSMLDPARVGHESGQSRSTASITRSLDATWCACGETTSTNPDTLAKLASHANLSADAFLAQFGYLVEDEPATLHLAVAS